MKYTSGRNILTYDDIAITTGSSVTKVIIIYLDSNLTRETIPTDSTEQVKEACCYIGSESTAFRLAPENTTTMGDSIAADSISI